MYITIFVESKKDYYYYYYLAAILHQIDLYKSFHERICHDLTEIGFSAHSYLTPCCRATCFDSIVFGGRGDAEPAFSLVE